MDITDFNPETAVIGGMSLIVMHQVIMAQIRDLLPDIGKLRKYFDLLNYPLAFLLILLVNPPWPLLSATEWQQYIAYSIATGGLASISAGKILKPEKKVIQEMQVEQALATPVPEQTETEAESKKNAEIRPIVHRS